MTYERERDFSILMAKKAGELLLKYHGRQNDKEWHTTTNFKTAIDDMSDKLIRDEIMRVFHEDDIYSEEQDPLNRGRERKWVYDPLDGTIPYTLHINNNWSVAISFVVGKKPVVGVVYMPERKELYVGVEGKGAFCNDIPINVSDETNLNRILMGVDDGKETKKFRRDSMTSIYGRINAPGSEGGIVCFVRSACASVPLCQVASGKLNKDLPLAGRLDAYAAGSLEPWDMSAAVAIIREAGGKVTTFLKEVREWQLGDPDILAANHALHEKLCRHLAGYI